MRVIGISILAGATLLASCTVGTESRVTTDSRVAEDDPVWGRADCQRGEGNAELQTEFDEAKATCLARGESPAAIAGNSPCMNERGYVFRTRADHSAACQIIPKGVSPKKSKSVKPAIAPAPPPPAAAAK